MLRSMAWVFWTWSDGLLGGFCRVAGRAWLDAWWIESRQRKARKKANRGYEATIIRSDTTASSSEALCQETAASGEGSVMQCRIRSSAPS